MTAAESPGTAAPMQGHRTDPADAAAAEWGGAAGPPAWVLARIAEEAELQGLGEARLADACRLLRALLRDAQRQADAMAAALALTTHEFVPGGDGQDGLCAGLVQWPWRHHTTCLAPADFFLHRTPSVVLSGLDAEATP